MWPTISVSDFKERGGRLGITERIHATYLGKECRTAPKMPATNFLESGTLYYKLASISWRLCSGLGPRRLCWKVAQEVRDFGSLPRAPLPFPAR